MNSLSVLEEKLAMMKHDRKVRMSPVVGAKPAQAGIVALAG